MNHIIDLLNHIMCTSYLCEIADHVRYKGPTKKWVRWRMIAYI